MASRDSRFRRLLVALAGRAGALLLRALGATWRIRTEGDDPIAAGRLEVGATWHRGMLMLAHYFRDRDLVVMVSRSRDGEWITGVLQRLGYAPPPRGSTSRGGTSALRRQIALVREGRWGGVLCDGPRGPARRLQPGALLLAAKTGLPLRLVAFSATPCIRFGSWDRVMLPLPFARVLCRYGPAWSVPDDTAPDELERLRAAVEADLNRLTVEADARLGVADDRPAESAPAALP